MKCQPLSLQQRLFIQITAATILAFPMGSPAQTNGKAELMQSALRAFAGDDLSHKKGPLVKVGFDLALLKEEYSNHKALYPLTRFVPSNSMIRVSDDRVTVEVITEKDPAVLESDLRALGMQITGKAGSMISGLLPISAIEAIAALESVRFARPATLTTSVGLTTSQGDLSMGSDVVRASLGFNGTGVTVAALSDSYNYLGGASTDVASGDLPGTGNPNGFTTPVNVLADNGTTDEGRAMLQLIHDVAPGAALAFATANGGQAAFANYITSLRTTAGADVIVDDVIYYVEPMFQDGVIAQAVDAATAAGVPYFSSAGNQASKSYESTWRAGPVLSPSDLVGTFFGGTTFDFDPGPAVDTMQAFTLGGGQTILLVFQWDSPFSSVCTGCPGSPNDLDIYVLNSARTRVVASAATDNLNGDAVEFLQFKNNGGSPTTFNIMITKYAGTDPGFLKYVNFGSTQVGLEFATNSSTIYGHANAAGAAAVAAAAFYNTPAFGVSPPVLESFSSRGPTAIRFTTTGTATYDPRTNKPQVTAPDGTNTTFFGSDISQDADAYPNFFGTSAAAPHAAAVAALMRQANGSATPAQIYSQLGTTAIDMGTPGFDNGSGYGLVQAVGAVDAIVPIELASFTGTLENPGTVRLDWSTLSETNNYGFEVQRKLESAVRFETIPNTFIPGHGTTLKPQHYSFTDVAPPEGILYYRLRQLDLDGSTHFTDVVQVRVLTNVVESPPVSFSLQQNYPNPFNPTTVVSYRLPVVSDVKLIVYDMLGREVAVLVNGRKQPGTYAVRFDTGLTAGEHVRLTSGVYFYRLIAGNYVQTRKLVLAK